VHLDVPVCALSILQKLFGSPGVNLLQVWKRISDLKEQNQYNRNISINYYQKIIIPLQEKIIIKKMMSF